MLEHRLHLLFHDARERLEKFVYGRAILQVFKQCPDRYSRVLEDPIMAHLPWG